MEYWATISWSFSMDVPENAGRDITTTANSDHKIRLEYIEDLLRG